METSIGGFADMAEHYAQVTQPLGYESALAEINATAQLSVFDDPTQAPMPDPALAEFMVQGMAIAPFDMLAEPLILASDLTDERALSGYLKFAEGFPATRIKLTLRHYPVIAKDVIRRNDQIIPISYAAGFDDDEKVDQDGVVTGAGRENEGANQAVSEAKVEIGNMIEAEIPSPSNASDALLAAHSHEAIAAQQRTGLGGETQTGAVSASPSSVPVQAKEALAAPPTLYDALAIRPVESGQAVKAATPANIKQAMIDHATDFGEPDAVHERGDRERG